MQAEVKTMKTKIGMTLTGPHAGEPVFLETGPRRRDEFVPGQAGCVCGHGRDDHREDGFDVMCLHVRDCGCLRFEVLQ